MVNRIKLTMQQPEYSALLDMAAADLRTPSDEAHQILRRELAGRGPVQAPEGQQRRPANLVEIRQAIRSVQAKMNETIVQNTVEERDGDADLIVQYSRELGLVSEALQQLIGDAR